MNTRQDSTFHPVSRPVGHEAINSAAQHLPHALSCTSIFHSTRRLTKQNLSYNRLFAARSYSLSIQQARLLNVVSHNPGRDSEIKPSTLTPSSPTAPQSPPVSCRLSCPPLFLLLLLLLPRPPSPTRVYTRQADRAPSSPRTGPSRPCGGPLS